MSDSIVESVNSTYPVHGFLGNKKWPMPELLVECLKEARPGMSGTKAAHEYEEHEEVFQDKIDLLAKIILCSRNCIAYTGAGISTAAGVPDYASTSAGTKSRVAQLLSSKSNTITGTQRQLSLFEKAEIARPTYAHMVLQRLYQAGWLKWWCQQNHDGLPQKAGVPQEIMNEIHGSWFDLSNRVVGFSEDLRSDLFENLLEWEKKADVCLTIGTSLSGMNADRLVVGAATRSFARWGRLEKQFSKRWEWNADAVAAVGGSIIIGYQCTPLDNKASLRIYSTIDRVFRALSDKIVQLTLQMQRIDLSQLFSQPYLDNPQALLQYMNCNPVYSAGCILQPDIYELSAYNSQTGLPKISHKDGSEDVPLRIDLRVGSKIKILVGIDKDCIATVMGRDSIGNYRFDCEVLCRYKASDGSFYRQMGHTTRIYGLWNLKSALDGKLHLFPFINNAKE